VQPAVDAVEPSDPTLEVTLPAFSPAFLGHLHSLSREAAQREAIARFEAHKEEHAGFVEQEVERLVRMFDSRRGLLDDRIARNERLIERLELHGTARQRNIIRARRGQIQADKGRLAELESERRERLNVLHTTLPGRQLELLGVTMIVSPDKLKEMSQ
jgi:predicted metalloprotease